MIKGTQHSETSKNKISEGMKESWTKRKTRTNANRKLITMSTLLNRAQLAARLGKQFGTDRDLYEILGYPTNLEFDDFFAKYKRQDIASRIVDAPASATWRRGPVIYEDSPKEPSTKFEKDWAYVDNKVKCLHYLEQVDRLSGIGQYGVLLIGINDGGSLEQPLKSKKLRKEALIYLSVLTEKHATISKFVDDVKDARFGKPFFYEVDLAGDLDLTSLEKIKVHYSRVLHIAESTLEDEIYGRPRLEPVFNLLHDLEKVVGGSAEMFWQGAYRGLHININPEYQSGDLDDTELDSLTDEIDEYVHGLRRFIRTMGVDVKPLDVELADPSGVFGIIMDLVSGACKIPKRILFGSERGELASEQDEVNWNSRIKERQEQFAEPKILRPFVDKLIECGILSEPRDEYKVEWPNLFELDELKRAQAAWTWGRAAEKLLIAVQGNLLSAEEARSMLGADPKKVPEDIDVGPQPDQTGGGGPSGTFDDPEPAPIPEPVIMRDLKRYIDTVIEETIEDKLQVSQS